MRKFWFIVSVIAAGAAAAAQVGGPGVTVGPMPNYFSGTNCRAYGGAQIGEPIVDAELYLNDELVREYHHSGDPLEPYPMSMGLAVMFDSSHFPDASPVLVKYRVRGLQTYTWQQDLDLAPVRNLAMLFEHPDAWSGPAETVFYLLHDKNYSFAIENTAHPWTVNDYFAAIDGSDIVLCYTHSTAFRHEAGDGEFTYPDDYTEHRTLHIGGGGLPPFNYGAPPVNVFYLRGCNAGRNTEWIYCLYPYYNQWGPFLENQVFFGFGCYIKMVEGTDLAREVFAPMSAGITAKDTLRIFNERLKENLVEYYARDDGGLERKMVPGDLRLYHSVFDDGSCRIKSVYTGTNTPPVGWVREIP